MIDILDDFPVILTKDQKWASSFTKTANPPQPGLIVILPEDAILVRCTFKKGDKNG